MRSIFVISIPRSGSTWASRAIASALCTHVINEPFNFIKHPGRQDYHMIYLPAGMHDEALQQHLRRILRHPVSLATALVGHRCQVVKDVHACLAVEQIGELTGSQFVFLIRHPCAVALSWASLNYEVDFRLERLLAQETLVEEHLTPFVSHMTGRREFFFQIGAFWGASYFVLNRISTRHPDWHWITHEELCIQSETRYQELIGRLGYQMNHLDRWYLRFFLNRHNRPRPQGERIYSVKRQSAGEPSKWRSQLTQAQTRAVLEGAAPFGLFERFYPPAGFPDRGPTAL
jgi:hypothetical protein